MSETPFTIDSAVMPCSSLYASCTLRRQLGLLHRALDGLRELVRVEQNLPVDVPGGSADRLHERGLAPKEALLVRVQDRDERDLGEVEPSRRRLTPTRTS